MLRADYLIRLHVHLFLNQHKGKEVEGLGIIHIIAALDIEPQLEIDFYML